MFFSFTDSVTPCQNNEIPVYHSPIFELYVKYTTTEDVSNDAMYGIHPSHCTCSELSFEMEKQTHIQPIVHNVKYIDAIVSETTCSE